MREAAASVTLAAALVRVAASAEELSIGKIIPSARSSMMSCASATQASTISSTCRANFTPQRRWAVIFGFDPGGRGRLRET
jgi:hypothetical protein